ncbi:MAG TPA: hypothetical protein PKG77_16565, partial [Phycisphaerae bacterium]|nr:hypothetical protein [Phycisphaerae bacterium]
MKIQWLLVSVATVVFWTTSAWGFADGCPGCQFDSEAVAPAASPAPDAPPGPPQDRGPGGPHRMRG